MTHSPASSSIPSVLVDTDPGLDDAVALLVLASAERRAEITIDSVFAVGGNVDSAQTARNALQLLSAAGLTAPVFRGATLPSSRRKLIAGAGDFHGPDGLGGMAEPDLVTPRRPRNIGSTFVNRVIEAKRPTNLLCIGPLTDLARALKVQSKFGNLVSRTVIMGGALGNPAGNISPCAEFNFYADPTSAAQVVTSSLPIELVPLDVSQAVVFTERDTLGLYPLAARIIRHSIEYHRKALGLDGAYLHDAVAAAILLHPELSRTAAAELSVKTDGQDAGRLLVEPRKGGRKRDTKSVVVEIDEELTKSFILDSLAHIHDREWGSSHRRTTNAVAAARL